MSVRSIAAATMAMAVAGSAAAQPPATSFTLVDRTYSVSAPQGLCPPAGENAFAEFMKTALSKQAVVGAVYFPCKIGDPPDSVAFEVVGAPRATLSIALPPRPQMIAQMKASIADGSLAAQIDEAAPMASAQKNLQDATGIAVKVSGDPKFVETDQNAAYLVGVIGVQMPGSTGQFLMVGAMTEVKGKLIGWYIYSPDTSTARAGVLLRRLKTDVAGFVRQNEG